jgi:hypothetical protein
VKKQYYFARLFVRAAKTIALLVIFIGIGLCVLRYYQANIAAGAIAYKPSPELQQALDDLKDEFLSAEQVIESFNAANQSPTPGLQGPRFPLLIESSEDLVRISAELSRVDQERQRLKESVVSRFETLVKGIEGKLHAYAAALQSSPSPAPAPAEDVAGLVPPSPPAAGPEDSLFSSKLNSSEARERSQSLAERTEFLKALGTKAENAENRVILNEAAEQVDQLARLLPEKPSASAPARTDSASNRSNEPRSEERGQLPPSERAARQLEQLRNNVRQMLLTSWRLDGVFEKAASLVSVEREKERAATVAQQGIWLSAAPRIVIGLLAAGLVGLLIVVFADLVQTQLDTATSGGIMADAILALRGLAKPASQSEPVIRAEEEWPPEGGS